MNRIWRQVALGLLVLLMALPCMTRADVAPQAIRGVIDLSALDLSGGAFSQLNGEWEFYWNRLLAPADFAAGREPAGKTFFPVPSAWKGARVNAVELTGRGYATYRLRLLPGAAPQELGIRLLGISSAFKLWVNGVLVMDNGTVGTSLASEVPYPSIRMPRIQSQGEPIEIVLQVSNFHDRAGGIVEPISVGSARLLEVRQVARWSLVLVIIGSLLLMGVYHLVLYGSRRSDPTTLYFGAYCLLWACNGFVSSVSDWVIRMFFTQASANALYAVEMFCFFVSIPVGYAFFQSLYPQEFDRRVLRLIAWAGAGFAGLALWLPMADLSRIVPFYYYFAIVLIVFACHGLYQAVRAQRDGSGLIAVGFLVLGATGINDMLNDLQLIHTSWMILYGMFVFVLAQSFALAHRFSRAFVAVEKLTGTLAEKNLALQEEMAERTRLEREIVQVGEEERRSISRDLHDGLCQQLTAARLRCSVLERDAASRGEHSEVLAQLAGLLEKSVDHAYELSRGLWPVEHDARSLVSSLEGLAEGYGMADGLEVSLSCKLGCGDCRNENSGQIYHIAKEALLNAQKHAGASKLLVSLDCRTRPANLVMTIEDNGVGRQAAKSSRGGLGIGIMAHRARMLGGTLVVSDRVGGGTVVQCSVPCVACLPAELDEV